MKFNELELRKEVLKAIEDMGFDTPTAIQEAIIPIILNGNDVLGRSQTGTGKTLAFLASILSTITLDKGSVKAIVVAPTRELAIQINDDLKKLITYLKIRSLCVYGNSSMETQIKELNRGVDIVIGTPGRILDLIKRKKLVLSNIEYFVFDEADEMLNMGFKEDIEEIFNSTSKEKQVLLFSATMPREIKKLAQNYMASDYQEINVINETKTSKNIEQKYFLVNENTKFEVLCRIFDYYPTKRGIVFCKTKRHADELFEKLSTRNYNVAVLHGDISQNIRTRTISRFKQGGFQYLIATDVAARGIDVDDLELIVNHSLPGENETYIHRIGRTGRAGRNGLAISLVTKREEKIIDSLERHVKDSITLDVIPTKEMIINNKYQTLIDSLDNTNRDSIFRDYLKSLTYDDLLNITSGLLEKNFEKQIGSDFSVGLDIKKSGKKDSGRSRNDKNSTRVFLTIGKLDKITKKDLLSNLEKMAGIPQGVMHGVEILTKFTFINIDNKYYDQLYKKCNNKSIMGRKISIEKAKK